ncbi:uncharacterized protein LOC131931375 [Physella acuta]|uniref:uncharacterized protein LOC131931375 n=1 Tax=Physella acuta TaxID=109671 RepID=UPI0027DDE957|nr:uncharacterized protein LOC131931375 [Physella acuta]
MLTKITPLLRIAPRIQQARMSHGVPAHWKTMRQICEENKNHMNFLPVPEGSWSQAYKAKNAKINLYLLSSALAFIATFGYLYKNGFMYLHSAPPMYNSKPQ